MKKIIFISFIAFVCVSCNYSNQFYFDIKNQSINACTSKGLQYLDFENDSLKLYFTLEWEGDMKVIPKKVTLDNLQDEYVIDNGWKKGKTIASNIKLAKSATYEIRASGGDVGPFYVTIVTDKNGKVVMTSHDKCD